MHTLEIKLKFGTSFFDLKEIMSAMGPVEMDYWRIVDLECVSLPTGVWAAQELEELVDSSPNGFIVTREQLATIAASIFQTIWCIVVGHQNSAPSIIVEAQDSTRWVVGSTSIGVVSNLQKQFSDTKIVAEHELEFIKYKLV